MFRCISQILLFSVICLLPILSYGDTSVPVPASGKDTTLTLNSNYAHQNLQITWDITSAGNGNYNYVYTIGYSGVIVGTPPGFNTFLLGVSPTITNSDLSQALFNLSQPVAALHTFASNQTIDVSGLPSNFYAAGFIFSGDKSSVRLSFTSPSAPIWGSAYLSNILINPAAPSGNEPNPFIGGLSVDPQGLAEQGGGIYTGSSNNVTYLLGGDAYNSSFGTSPPNGTTNFNGWIPIPGTFVPTPEPSIWLLFASFLGLILYLKQPKILGLRHTADDRDLLLDMHSC